MDLSKELYQQIREDARPELVEIEGRKYSTGKLNEVFEPQQKALEVTALTSLKDYIESKVDEIDKSKILLHVKSPTEVCIISGVFGEFKQRTLLMQAKASTLPDIKFNTYLHSEPFNIQTQACFVDSFDRAKVLAFSGNAQHVISSGVSDDGVTQAVSVAAGVASKASKALPNPVTLQPFRTFLEVKQPASAFIFRASGGEEGKAIMFGLWEADGGAWRMIAMQNIKNWLAKNIPGVGIIA